jgi:hypothetical protein
MNEQQPKQPPLKPLHSETSLSPAKLTTFQKLSTEVLNNSLAPGQEQCLKTRPDGTILDGHHRVHILRGRGEDVDAFPREVLDRSKIQG